MPLGVSRLNSLGKVLSLVPTRTANTITNLGDTIHSTAQSKFGTSSAFFDGTGDRLTVPYSSAFDLAQNSNWTFECWFRTPSVATYRVIVQQTKAGTQNGWWLDANGTTFRLIDRGSSSYVINLKTSAFAINTWYHIALVRRNGTTLEAYVDGVRSYQNNSYTAKLTTDQPLKIGRGAGISNSLWTDADSNSMFGWLDEIRISTVARYDGNNFTPQTTPFENDADTVLLLHCNDYNGSTTFIDDGGQTITESTRPALTPTVLGNAAISTSEYKIGSSSYVGDGTGDCLRYADYTLTLGVNDFTIEFYVRLNSTSAQVNFYDQRTASTSQVAPTIYMTAFGSLNYYVSNAIRITGTNGQITTNTWYHVALSRNGSSTRLFLDGTQVGSTYTDTNNYVNQHVIIGAFRDAAGTTTSFSLNGYMDELRVSNIARYTANFTPSTTAFEPDINTLLLLHMEGTNGSTTFTDSV